ncbi:MAG: FkbM family methyltransferase [Bacteroidia bacterium]|nr:FkbM family methyltransferase [Bacteroidia bacterium]
MLLRFKKLLKKIPIPLTKNHGYDLRTKRIIKNYLHLNSNTIDVGCHKGEILEIILNAAPDGRHWGLEPLPYLYEHLKLKFSDKNNIEILPVAATDREGFSDFNHVITNPAYSGLKKRDYDRANEKDEKIQVKTQALDNLIPEVIHIDLIKIDVEGGEYQVLLGAQRIIKTFRPMIIFEHGLGSSEYYDSTPDKVFNFFEEMDMHVSTLLSFIKRLKPFTEQEFEEQYYRRMNYYFIAYGK